MIHIILLLILWSQPNPQVQQVNFTPPAFTPSSVKIDVWLVSEFTCLAENRSDNAAPVSFGDKAGEGVCGTSLRLRADAALSGPALVDFPQNVPPFTVLLPAFDGIDDFGGASGFTRVFTFTEHSRIVIDNPNVIAKLAQGRVFMQRPGYVWIRWSGNGAFGTRARHGARIKVTFRE